MRFLFLILFLSLKTLGAPAPRGPLCIISGVVEKIEIRKEKYHDRNWAESWGLPEFKTYTDIKIKIKTSKEVEKGFGRSCGDLEKIDFFQLRSDEKKPLIGSCIKAYTQYSGDEFTIGQWVYKISKCDSKS